MKSAAVQVPPVEGRRYNLHVGFGTFDELDSIVSEHGSIKVLGICDAGVRAVSPLLKDLPWPIVEITQNGEGQKTAAVLETLWEVMLSHKLDRGSLIIAIGGGATCDVVGFAASTYMRGIRLINVPTTLLSQVDSSIGGKTAINLGKVKNIPGTFAPPQAVIIDLEFLKTLPAAEFASGCAEIIKHGVISDGALFQEIVDAPIALDNREYITDIVFRSLEVKRKVVEADPFEKNLRKTLNFGHTIGHAFEAMSHAMGKPMLHGEAISIGMILETKLALQKGILKTDITKDLTDVLTQHKLPVVAPTFDQEKLLKLIESDKKNRDGALLFALPEAIGTCRYDIEVTPQEILKVLS